MLLLKCLCINRGIFLPIPFQWLARAKRRRACEGYIEPESTHHRTAGDVNPGTSCLQAVPHFNSPGRIWVPSRCFSLSFKKRNPQTGCMTNLRLKRYRSSKHALKYRFTSIMGNDCTLFSPRCGALVPALRAKLNRRKIPRNSQINGAKGPVSEAKWASHAAKIEKQPHFLYSFRITKWNPNKYDVKNIRKSPISLLMKPFSYDNIE